MEQDFWTRFLITSTLLVSIGFAIGAIVTPPVPMRQLPVLVMVVILAVPISYWLVYRGALSRLWNRIRT